MATAQDEILVDRPGRLVRRTLITLGVLVGAVFLYYVGGALWLHHIDDDTEFGANLVVPQGGSRAVAVTAALADREVNQRRWLANDPFFLPGYLLDNTPNFQVGVMTALGRFAIELRDRLGRVRGSSAVDPDLESAAGRINYPGDVWILEWSGQPVQPSSEGQFRRGVSDLQRYNERLAQGSAVFERRNDNLLYTLDRISDDIGSVSAAQAQRIEQHATVLFDFGADDLFYQTKGRLYAYYLILRELEHDFVEVLRGRGLEVSWDEMLHSARLGAVLYPWVVTNGPMESQVVPNHLSSQGFFLLRFRTKLEEIVDILRN